jgi:hypothetical protein
MFSLGPTEVTLVLLFALVKLAVPVAVVLLIVWAVRHQRRDHAPRPRGRSLDPGP